MSNLSPCSPLLLKRQGLFWLWLVLYILERGMPAAATANSGWGWGCEASPRSMNIDASSGEEDGWGGGKVLFTDWSQYGRSTVGTRGDGATLPKAIIMEASIFEEAAMSS